VTDLGRSSHSGSAWVTATRTVVGGISLDDIVLSDNAAARDHARIISRTMLERLKLGRSCGTVPCLNPSLNLGDRLYTALESTHYVSFWHDEY